jgi:predicted nucleic acid-binding Zn ribbon protein
MIETLITEALSTSDKKRLIELAKSKFMNVRRAVAQNKNTPTETLEVLALDCALNVSFKASQNLNNQRKFDLDFEHKCITCNEPENKLNCASCNILQLTEEKKEEKTKKNYWIVFTFLVLILIVSLVVYIKKDII